MPKLVVPAAGADGTHAMAPHLVDVDDTESGRALRSSALRPLTELSTGEDVERNAPNT